jgi:membrane-associated phospholipid phosphatase
MSEHAYTAATPRSRPTASDRARSGPGGPFALAVGCVLALALVWVLAALVPAIHYRDAVALHDFARLDSGPVDRVAARVTHLLEPLLFTLWGVAIVAVGLARARPRRALAAAGVMALAPLTAEILKPLLAHPHAVVGGTYLGAASWPSGHATAALALALAATFVAPARLRRLVAALGVAFAAAVGFALVVRASHMPSDVIGGYLVASFWAAAALTALRTAELRWPARRSG